MVWVVPKLTAVFASRNRELPWITEVVVSISNFAQNYGAYVLAFIVLAILAFRYAMKNPQTKLRWHQIILNSPGWAAGSEWLIFPTGRAIWACY